ncbi:MAG: glycosyltransferase family 2 protein [Clostridiales bacterium]|nr:glycosyltransferase family 2 protein [Clostridiales bacterium]
MVTISLCMIVKNEEAVLGRVLKQMKEIADEIIVVDTGSTDRTKEIAAAYTDRIYDFAWRDDFSAARNFACEKATMDYWMWLDADDVIGRGEREKLLLLKEEMDTSADVVMMRYQTGFDEAGRVTFSYWRERILKNRAGFRWEGRVHEAVVPRGNIVYSNIAIEHRKEGAGDPDRNLRIYERMMLEGERLNPREQYYYGRELFFHGRYPEAENVFRSFLRESQGWAENKIDACVLLAKCLERLGKEEEREQALFSSFLFDVPRAEACCEIGRCRMEQERYPEAVWWHRRALESETGNMKGGFLAADFCGFIPAIQLCVCYDRMGDRERALYYHRLSAEYRPDSPAVAENQRYFFAEYAREDG